MTILAACCYGNGMARAANNLPQNRKASERERACFKRPADLEVTVPKFGSRPSRQIGEVLARHRAQWPMLSTNDVLAEQLAVPKPEKIAHTVDGVNLRAELEACRRLVPVASASS